MSADDAALGTGGGYRLYQSKTSGVYAGLAPVATVAPGVATVTIPAPPMAVYYWVIVAFAASGVEADPSNEISAAVKPGPAKNLRIPPK